MASKSESRSEVINGQGDCCSPLRNFWIFLPEQLLASVKCNLKVSQETRFAIVIAGIPQASTESVETSYHGIGTSLNYFWLVAVWRQVQSLVPTDFTRSAFQALQTHSIICWLINWTCEVEHIVSLHFRIKITTKQKGWVWRCLHLGIIVTTLSMTTRILQGSRIIYHRRLYSHLQPCRRLVASVSMTIQNQSTYFQER